jgi:hypothetical protein
MRGVPVNLVGQRVGRLMVLTPFGHNARGEKTWLCQCDCGAAKIVPTTSLRNQSTRSCGCLNADVNKAKLRARPEHGMSGSPLFPIWRGMMNRCYRPETIGFKNWGGRGIKVCPRWHDVTAFIADMSPRPPGATLDRINVDGDYEPSNCRWVSLEENNNNRRNSMRLTHEGVTRGLAQWARHFGVNGNSLRYHIYRGRPLIEAVNHLKGVTT